MDWLLFLTECLSLTAPSGAGVLSTHSDSPPMPQTTMGTDLLHPLNIITQLGIEVLSENLGVLSSLEILLPIEEPKWDLELTRVLDDSNQLLNLIRSELSGALGDINLGLLADKVGETTSKSLDFGQSENNITLSFNIRIQNTKNVLELGSLH